VLDHPEDKHRAMRQVRPEERGVKSRCSAMSAAQRELIPLAVVGRGIRTIDVSRLLRISTASVAEPLAALPRDEGV